jgi:hypothetical protein
MKPQIKIKMFIGYSNKKIKATNRVGRGGGGLPLKKVAYKMVVILELLIITLH